MNDLVLILDSDEGLELSLDGSTDFELTLENASGSVYPVYDGATEFTPTRETQFAMVSGKIVLDNIKINPIPQNYGLVTYNGSIITIS